MSISLSAEQKSINELFSIPGQYVVPSYQRPYSWEYDHCFQLYNDLMNSFEKQEDYFIGNIILAKSLNIDDNKKLQVVDGQQRLISIWLLLKTLNILYPQMTILDRLLEIEARKGNSKYSRIKSEIFESTDGADLDVIFKMKEYDFNKRLNEVSDKQGRVSERLCNNRIETNCLFFYSWLLEFNKSTPILQGENYIEYLLDRVSLLPIELIGSNMEEANSKALVIFETINNRGMNLEDADIFKAKLYEKAKRKGEEESFIQSWVDFKSSCDLLQIKIDDVFRYYSHTIRGKQGITIGEKNLREFFTNESFSPFNFKGFDEIMTDLFEIVEILEYLEQEKNKETKLSAWLQIIDAYTNQYPKFAIVNYLYVCKADNEDDFIKFVQSLVRYIYYQGSTSTIKFEIYNIIKQTSSKQIISTYAKNDIYLEYFSSLGRLKKGFALLAHHLSGFKVVHSYTVDRIITPIDKKQFSEEEWNKIDLDTLGNFIILDIPKRNIPLDRKRDYYHKSNIEEVRSLLENKFNFGYNNLERRDGYLKNFLLSFFKGE